MPEQLLEFLKQPFSDNMSATRWFMFVGLVLIMLWIWHMIFRDLAEVEGAVT